MWFAYDGEFSLRHSCEHGDRLQWYGWIRHDGTSFGQQEITDSCGLTRSSNKALVQILYLKGNVAVYRTVM